MEQTKIELRQSEFTFGTCDQIKKNIWGILNTGHMVFELVLSQDVYFQIVSVECVGRSLQTTIYGVGFSVSQNLQPGKYLLKHYDNTILIEGDKIV